MKEGIATSFILERELYWRLKQVAANKKLLMKEAFGIMVNWFVEEHEDISRTDEIKDWLQKAESEHNLEGWCDYKRRKGIEN